MKPKTTLVKEHWRYIINANESLDFISILQMNFDRGIIDKFEIPIENLDVLCEGLQSIQKTLKKES